MNNPVQNTVFRVLKIVKRMDKVKSVNEITFIRLMCIVHLISIFNSLKRCIFQYMKISLFSLWTKLNAITKQSNFPIDIVYNVHTLN